MTHDEGKRAAKQAFAECAEAGLQHVREVRVVDMDAAKNQLVGEDGSRFEEVETNIWGRVAPPAGLGRRRILYLGTGRHGGGIILRALYVRTAAGAWLNGATGAPAPFPDSRKAAW